MAAGSTRVIVAALVGNALIAVTKFAAGSFTGSKAMLSEAVHSLVDTGNQILLLYGLRRSRRPASSEFPFGHGKEVYFWSFVVAILIFAGGAAFSIYEGVQHLLDPKPMQNPGINYLVLSLAMIFEGVAWTIAFRHFSVEKGEYGYLEAVRRGKDPTLFVVLFEDSAAMLGLLIAFSGIALSQVTREPRFDGIAAIMIGLVLAATAVWLAYETKSLLIGESADRGVVERIRGIAASREGIECVNEVLTMHMGPDFVLVNISVDFADEVSAVEVERTIAGIDEEIKSALPEVKRVFVEAEARHYFQPTGS